MWLDPDGQNLQEQMQIVGAMSAGDLFGAAFYYNWDSHPYEVLGAIADRPDCSLLTAMLIFTQASPGSYADEASQLRNPRHVAFLDRIQRRINAGEYRHDEKDHERLWERRHFDLRLEKSAAPFLTPQERPDGSSAVTVWWLDPRIVLPALRTPSEVQAANDEAKKDLQKVAMDSYRGIFDVARKYLTKEDKAELLASLKAKTGQGE